MTEHEWLTCTQPDDLLRMVEDRVSTRKRGLFAVACCRRIWHLLPDERSRRAVEVYERFVDGHATVAERATAEGEAQAVCDDAQAARDEAYDLLNRADSDCFDTAPTRDAFFAARTRLTAAHAPFLLGLGHGAMPMPECVWECATAVGDHAEDAAQAAGNNRGAEAANQTARQAEEAAQCDLLREVVGNPFRPPRLVTAWLHWNEGTIARIAQAVYEERAFDSLPILADALEEAGCTDPDILAHLRGSGPHARGCWVVDALLGKS